MRKFAILFFLIACAPGQAAELASNVALRTLMQQDQAARVGNAINWKKVSEDDTERRNQVAKMLDAGVVKTSEDFYNAALIFQHGQLPEDITLAYSLASISKKLDPGNKAANWLTAASWDRIMMQMGKPQWYGTQFTKSHASGSKWELYKIDETAVTDEDRKALNVPSLAEAKARVQSLNENG